jgi:hypothetical protein
MDKQQKQALAETYKYAKMMLIEDASAMRYNDIARALKLSESFKGSPTAEIQDLAEWVKTRFSEMASLADSTLQQQTKELVEDIDKHSMIGRILRKQELKKKVDQTWQDAVDAEKRGDMKGSNRSFNKHVRYTNLERPGTWRTVKEGDEELKVGDKIRTIKGGQIPGTIEKIEGRDAYFRHPEGKLYKTFLGNVRKDIDENVSGAVAEAFPYDVDHMPGPVIRNADLVTNNVKVSDLAHWNRAVSSINSRVFDDETDFISNSKGKKCVANGVTWAVWDNATQTGWFNAEGHRVRPMKENAGGNGSKISEAAPVGGIGPSNAARLLHTLLVKKLPKVRNSEQLDALAKEAEALYSIAGEESKFYHNYIWWQSGDLYDSVKKKIEHLRSKFGVAEVAAPGQEDWINANKDNFIKQYGKDKGLSVLYATAWKRSKTPEALNENPEDDAYAAELDRLRGLLRAARKEWNTTGDRSYYDRAEKEYARGYDMLVQKYPDAHRRQAAASQAAVYKEPAPKRYSSY